MPFSCSCGWNSRGGTEDLCAHIRGRHNVDTSHPKSHKWHPAPDGLQCNRRCVTCDKYFKGEEALLAHLREVHRIDVIPETAKRK
mmetsp:Transcript_58234/g.136446  ORF Transcript_58234/g.136446 Transcript_58234/m.136446 type:complete len:85 (-) Transcript_58234:117-371(-)